MQATTLTIRHLFFLMASPMTPQHHTGRQVQQHLFMKHAYGNMPMTYATATTQTAGHHAMYCDFEVVLLL